MSDDFYKILGISCNASQEEIRKQYKRLAMEFHPDKHPENVDFYTKKFADITNAYKVLIDSESRKYYDMTSTAPGRKTGARQPSSFNGRSQLDDLYERFYGPSNETTNSFEIPSRAKYPAQRSRSYSEVEKNATNSVFKTPTSVSSSPLVQSGSKEQIANSDLQTTLTGQIVVNVYCTLEELNEGTQKVFTVTRSRDGIIDNKNCTVTLYPGIETGTEIVAAGQGNKAHNQPADNIIFRVCETKHSRFKRVGNDIHETIHINLKQALLGFTLNTTDIKGELINRNIEGISGSDHTEVISGRGMIIPKTEQRGNYIIKIKIDLPSKLTPEQRAAVSNLF